MDRHEFEVLERSILATINDEGLDPDRLPLGAAHGLLPDSDTFLPVAKSAEIPEANTRGFLRQVEAWQNQFRFAWMIDRDRRELEFALDKIQKAIEKLLIAFAGLDNRKYGLLMLNIRITNGKANMGPLGNADWRKLVIEDLSNGDQVAVSSHWEPPDPFDGISPRDMEAARTLAAGGQYRADSRSPDWFG